MKNLYNKLFIGACLSLSLVGCQREDLLQNPNVSTEQSLISPSLLLNHITANLMREEAPIDSQVYRWEQYLVSNYSYYFGENSYNWSNTNDMYDMLTYCNKMEEQANKQSNGSNDNVYFALSQFFKAYGFIWLSQRVGDIPMTEAGNPNKTLTPAYDNQKEVYKNCLQLLENANATLGKLAKKPDDILDKDGDIYKLTYLKWQKVINTYRLRVLISLSKRAEDTPELNIKGQFAEIINNPTKYPIMTSNDDNLAYRYTDVTVHPSKGRSNYNNCANISETYYKVTRDFKDPRVFVVSTPALAEIAKGKKVSDFSAYVGENNNKSQAEMSSFTSDDQHSNLNYARYMSSSSGANSEPYVILGYSELCFNIAEAANRGWIGANAADWYTKGVNASLDMYGIKQDKEVSINGPIDGKDLKVKKRDANGKEIKDADNKSIEEKISDNKVKLDVNTFLANITYKGGEEGLKQILTQKYVSFFMNSGFEAYYNWRRTGYPQFSQGGAGIGTPNKQIPLRWKYPISESNNNQSNYQKAVQSQYGGNDDIMAKMWLIK